MKTPEKLGLTEFKRRLVVGTFPEYSELGEALEGIGFVQADPIRAPARAQDLMLRQRVFGYAAGELEAQFSSLEVEEGYLFAYGFMRREVWRELGRRPRRKLTPLEREVYAEVVEMGEVHPRELEKRFGKQTVRNDWGGKSQATKRILEALHGEGYLRVRRREKGVRVYSVSDDSEEGEDDPRERYGRLVLRTAHAFGPATKGFLLSELRSLRYLLPKRSEREKVIEELEETGALETVEVEGVRYLWIREEWQGKAVKRRVRILAPFDPLVRDRQRFEQVWGWRYRFEAYVPAARRERGYYAMPLLWGEEVIGWANGKVEGERLEVEVGYEGKRPGGGEFKKGIEVEVEAMARFLRLESGAWALKV